MAAREVKLVEAFARFGYGARGLIYLMVAWLAVLAALDAGGRVTGSKGALSTFLSEPLGWIWLGVVGLGLFSHAIWRLLQAATDADSGNVSQSKAFWSRIVHVVSATVYFGLAGWAVTLAVGWAGGGGDSGPKDWTAWLLNKPLGPWLIMAVGIAVTSVGFAFYWKSLKDDFSENFRGEASEFLGTLGKIGYAARGVLFNIIGGFLIIAGLQSDPSEAKGLGGALRTLQQQHYGWILLGLTATGLAAFGAFNVGQAVYGRIHPPAKERLVDD